MLLYFYSTPPGGSITRRAESKGLWVFPLVQVERDCNVFVSYDSAWQGAGSFRRDHIVNRFFFLFLVTFLLLLKLYLFRRLSEKSNKSAELFDKADFFILFYIFWWTCAERQ